MTTSERMNAQIPDGWSFTEADRALAERRSVESLRGVEEGGNDVPRRLRIRSLPPEGPTVGIPSGSVGPGNAIVCRGVLSALEPIERPPGR